MSEPKVRRCVCGHDEERHEHYRPGTDCSVPGCRCTGFWRPWREVLREWWARLRRA